MPRLDKLVVECHKMCMSRCIFHHIAIAAALLVACADTRAEKEPPIGERPYEMVWANRTADFVPPLVDFEDVSGWKIETTRAVATFASGSERPLWGPRSAKLTYRAQDGTGKLTLRPPQPVPIAAGIDCVHLWVYGNTWAYSPNPTTPPVSINILLQDSAGKPMSVSLGSVHWKEWWCMQRKLRPPERERVRSDMRLTGIEVTNIRNTEDRSIHLDNLACYAEPLPPFTFKPRAKRGIAAFPGQDVAPNTGTGQLPFPTREETILPDQPAKESRASLNEKDGGFTFRYEGGDGKLEYRYDPKTGTLGDITARWHGRGGPFKPMEGGGILFPGDTIGSFVAPEKAEPIDCARQGDTVRASWRLTAADRKAEVTYTFRLWGRSLVIDVACPGGSVGRVAFGRATGLAQPRLVTIPYLVGGPKARPAALVSGPPDQPLFLMGMVDHCRSGASQLWFDNTAATNGVTYNGGSEYIPKNNGRRNDCFERLFLTCSPGFEDVLPNIPNPKSPWMNVTGDVVWRAHGASDREKDIQIWRDTVRLGMRHLLVTDHETGWRDGGESFTFRTRAAPGKGGDEGQARYAREMIGLGIRYGIYNQFCDLGAVNEFWNPDMIARTPDGDWQPAWARCHRPKPIRAVEYGEIIPPQIQKKFGLNTAYCDVHTALTPWSTVDYDPRAPGAGTFAATFYAYGEVMLLQKAAWNGPVYSEGNNHWYYSGLTDGNYGQDQNAHLDVQPWLVDFDIRKMHPLNCNFGIGNGGMFYGKKENFGDTPEEKSARLDRFLTASLAFGHTGFLVRETGTPGMARSYFMVQQIHANYARETAESIQYADENGHLLDTSAAVARGAFCRSQVLTRYSNGLVVAANGHTNDIWRVDLGGATRVIPPDGFVAILPGEKDGAPPRIFVSSSLRDGHRADYADTPEYVYADGRGAFTRFERVATDGPLVVLPEQGGSLEAIPLGDTREFAVSAGGQAGKVIALDKDRRPMGPANSRWARGLVHIEPVKEAFSYRIEPCGPPPVALSCDSARVFPGDTITIRGKENHTVVIPRDARAGERIWIEKEGGCIDFDVAPLAVVRRHIEHVPGGPGKLAVEICTEFPSAKDAEIECLGEKRRIALRPGVATSLHFDIPAPSEPSIRDATLRARIGDRTHTETGWIMADFEDFCVAALELDGATRTGMCLRGKPEEPIDAAAKAAVHPSTAMDCGRLAHDGLSMHPPYAGGTGYAFAEYGPILLPNAPATVRALVGKRNGSDPGDGILFRIAVVGEDGDEKTATEKVQLEHAWSQISGDLSQWAGQRIRVKLVADCGTKDNTSGDWACWADAAIASSKPALVLTLHQTRPSLRYRPGPDTAPLSPAQLHSAKQAWLCYEAIGVSGSSHPSTVFIGDAEIGRLAAGPASSETRNDWGKEVRMPLGPDAIARLSEFTPVRIHNPKGDAFKIRNARIELELADGHRAASTIATTTYTQPRDWLYAEGTGVPADQDIRLTIRFAQNP